MNKQAHVLSVAMFTPIHVTDTFYPWWYFH